MAKQDTRLPSSSGGIVSYNEAGNSKIQIPPGMVIVIVLVVMLIAILSQIFFGGGIT